MQTIEVKNLSFAYGEADVLRDVSFSFHESEILSVLGPNGAGKSTLFRCILGALKAYRGDILIGGTDTRTMTPKTLAGHIAYIPQIHRPSFGYTVSDVVLMGMTRQLSLFASPSAAHEQQAYGALQRLGMERFYQRDFGSLSGGEQQMVLIARAVAQGSRFLVMDEPTSALDYGNQMRVLNEIRRLTKEGYGVLLSTHNPQHALGYADRVLALSGGSVLADGDARETLTEELIRLLYGIDACFADTRAGRVIVPFVSGVP
ncbi:MAG: ABC transporter ATP-binding protein [Lachnospiraceae bacterium]|nr:ABC transporter ATP-binding protein [Lachnospiraceae bacterium]